MSRFDAGLLARAMAAVGVGKPATVFDEPQEPDAVAVAAELCRRFEGFYSHPYLCPAGVPTIGFGATHYADGRAVTLKDALISRDAGERLLLLMIQREYLPKVLKLCPGVVDPKRLAALIDFTFNLGGSALASSTLRKRVNAGRWEDVPAELRKWVKAAGRTLRGLVLRREAEVDLI